MLVRFIFFDGYPNVECKIDGVTKYTDEAGICDFPNIAETVHNYSVRKDGYIVDSSRSTTDLGETLYDSGSFDLAGVGVPAGYPYRLKFYMKEGTIPPPPPPNGDHSQALKAAALITLGIAMTKL